MGICGTVGLPCMLPMKRLMCFLLADGVLFPRDSEDEPSIEICADLDEMTQVPNPVWNTLTFVPFAGKIGGMSNSGVYRLFVWGFFVALVLLLLGLAGCSGRVQADQAADWRFGIIETYESPADAAPAGAAWTRVRFHWGDAQPDGPATWLPPVTLEQIDAEIASGREVTGMLIGTPDWARGEDLLPQGLWLPPDDPQNLWANYVRQVVGRYAGRINHWVIWNEPDIWEKAAPGHTWDGTVEDFLQLQRTAYLVAKQTNPNAIIHLAAFTYFWDANYGREQYFSRLLDAILADPAAATHNYYFDVATAHLYFQPNLIYDVIQAFRQMMADHGLDKPLWLMETNAPPIDDPAWPVESPTLLVAQVEQAAFMPQALAVALAAGAERVAVFKLKDTTSDRAANPEPFGLLRMDGSRRPAYDTYQVAVQYLSGVQGAARERWNEVGQIRLDQAGFSTTVLFARLPFPQQAQVPATGDRAVLVDMWGAQQTLRPVNGVYVVDLPAALCTQPIGDYCMIGGETFYLVQAMAGGALPAGLPAINQSPTALPLPTPTVVAPLPTPAGMVGLPTVTPQPLPTATSSPELAQAMVQSNEAIVDYPREVTFRLELAEQADVRQATLVYGLRQQTCVEVDTQVPVEVTGRELTWTWAMVRSGNPPPGAQLWWEWRLTDANGQTGVTPRQTLTFSDDRFDWRVVQAEGIHLHWYKGDEVGPLLLDAAVAGLAQLEADMGITLQGDVQFYIYGDSAEMRDAVLYIQDWAGGVAFAEYNTILIGVPPDIADSWGRTTVRHELAHLVVEQFAWSCVGGRRPTWLNEGLAVYAQGPPDEVTRSEIAQGIAQNLFMPLRSLNGAFPSHSEQAGLAYSQSYSVVDFMLARYGAPAMQTLLQTLAAGAGYDEALQAVYDLNVDGLETAWRATIGAPARVIPPTPTAVVAASIPTIVPLSGAQSMPTPPSAAATAAPAGTTTNDSPGISVCGVGLAPLLLFGWFGRRRQRQSDATT